MHCSLVMMECTLGSWPLFQGPCCCPGPNQYFYGALCVCCPAVMEPFHECILLLPLFASVTIAALHRLFHTLQVFTSDHALKLDWLPKWIAIIGSGYIGLEFSDVYTALGSDVTFVEVCALDP